MICKDLYHRHTYVYVFCQDAQGGHCCKEKKEQNLKLTPVELQNQNHNLKGRHIVNIHGDKIQKKIK